jgi:hypothetical protein
MEFGFLFSDGAVAQESNGPAELCEEVRGGLGQTGACPEVHEGAVPDRPAEGGSHRQRRVHGRDGLGHSGDAEQPLRNPSILKRLGLALEMPIDFLMEQRMLRTIKRLSESG